VVAAFHGEGEGFYEDAATRSDDGSKLLA